MAGSGNKKHFTSMVPEGDERERSVCGQCGFIDYHNPRMIVGVVAAWEGRILLCKRAIGPRKGFWTLPAGFMEVGESMEQGAAREAWEEARARFEFDGLLGAYDVTHASQVHMIFRARLITPDVEAGPESEAVGLFVWDDIPWDEIAFPSVRWALNDYRASLSDEILLTRAAPPGETGAW